MRLGVGEFWSAWECLGECVKVLECMGDFWEFWRGLKIWESLRKLGRVLKRLEVLESFGVHGSVWESFWKF